jgi:sarcosine oxidase subunit alpha
VLKEGAQLIDSNEMKPPVPMLGHVTSSYYSAFLGRSIAMGFVINGIKRRDDERNNSVYAWANGKAVKVKIVSSVFVDAEGARHDI